MELDADESRRRQQSESVNSQADAVLRGTSSSDAPGGTAGVVDEPSPNLEDLSTSHEAQIAGNGSPAIRVDNLLSAFGGGVREDTMAGAGATPRDDATPREVTEYNLLCAFGGF